MEITLRLSYEHTGRGFKLDALLSLRKSGTPPSLERIAIRYGRIYSVRCEKVLVFIALMRS